MYKFAQAELRGIFPLENIAIAIGKIVELRRKGEHATLVTTEHSCWVYVVKGEIDGNKQLYLLPPAG